MGFLEVNVSFFPIVVATVVYFFIGWLWYGPLFGRQWMREMKMGVKDIKKAKEKGMAKSMAINFVATLISIYVLAVLVSSLGVIGWSAGAYLGVMIWLGFYATIGVGGMLWEKKSLNFFLISSGYHLVGLVISGAILGSF